MISVLIWRVKSKFFKNWNTTLPLVEVAYVSGNPQQVLKNKMLAKLNSPHTWHLAYDPLPLFLYSVWQLMKSVNLKVCSELSCTFESIMANFHRSWFYYRVIAKYDTLCKSSLYVPYLSIQVIYSQRPFVGTNSVLYSCSFFILTMYSYVDQSWPQMTFNLIK